MPSSTPQSVDRSAGGSICGMCMRGYFLALAFRFEKYGEKKSTLFRGNTLGQQSGPVLRGVKAKRKSKAVHE